MADATKRKLPPKGSQGRTVYDYLKLGHSLTSREAWEQFEIMRLPNRISELKNKYEIEETIYQITRRSKTNKRVKWEEYSFSPLEAA